MPGPHFTRLVIFCDGYAAPFVVTAGTTTSPLTVEGRTDIRSVPQSGRVPLEFRIFVRVEAGYEDRSLDLLVDFLNQEYQVSHCRS